MLDPRQQYAGRTTAIMESSSPAYKKATAALDEAARARLRGPFDGGGGGGGHDDFDDGLVDLVYEFYNGHGERGAGADVAGAEEPPAPRPAEWKGTLRAALDEAAADSAAARIRDEAELAVRGAGPGVAGGERIRKLVVERLRARGFDAGICRSSWERSGSVPAGSHEYVDVTVAAAAGSSAASRYIVEANAAGEFEIARPSAEYEALLRALPPVLVAAPEGFREVAAAMCAAAAESIRAAGMHVAPWRRARYVQAKWSGQHKRVAATSTATAAHHGASTAAAARRHGGRKHCGMELGRKEMMVGRKGLVTRGL